MVIPTIQNVFVFNPYENYKEKLIMDLQGSTAPNWKNIIKSQVPSLTEELELELEGEDEGRDFSTMLEYH